MQVTHLFILLRAAQAHTLLRLLLLRYLRIFNEGGLFGGKLDLSKTALDELTRSFLVLRRAMGTGEAQIINVDMHRRNRLVVVNNDQRVLSFIFLYFSCKRTRGHSLRFCLLEAVARLLWLIKILLSGLKVGRLITV